MKELDWNKYTRNVLLGARQDKELVYWMWEYENALAIIGKGGSGKTTATLYWISQLAAMGTRFVMCDPHANHKESLYAQSDFMHKTFLLPCAIEYDEILHHIQYVHALGTARVKGIEQNHFPVVLVIDEFTSFILNYPEAKLAVTNLLDSINQFRKVNVRLFAISQTWTQAIKIASGLRDAISSSIVLKSSFNDASKFCSTLQVAREASTLTPGVAYYLDEKLWIPKITSTSKLAVSKKLQNVTYQEYTLKEYDVLYSNEAFLEDYRSF